MVRYDMKVRGPECLAFAKKRELSPTVRVFRMSSCEVEEAEIHNT
jgi:hypothetical protein